MNNSMLSRTGPVSQDYDNILDLSALNYSVAHTVSMTINSPMQVGLHPLRQAFDLNVQEGRLPTQYVGGSMILRNILSSSDVKGIFNVYLCTAELKVKVGNIPFFGDEDVAFDMEFELFSVLCQLAGLSGDLREVSLEIQPDHLVPVPTLMKLNQQIEIGSVYMELFAKP